MSAEAPNLKRSHSSSDEEDAPSSPGVGDDGDGDVSDGQDSTNSEQQNHLLSQVTIGTRIAVYWPDDDKYYHGTVAEHIPNDWQYHVYKVDYDDGDIEKIDLSMERFRITGGERRSRKEVQCLTVYFDQNKEMWRSPPTYHGGGEEDFVWPRGWVEVLRQASSDGGDGGSEGTEGGSQEGQSHNQQKLSGEEQNGGGHEVRQHLESSAAQDTQQQTTDMHQKSQEEQINGHKQTWIREFHPPHKKGRGGKQKICHTIEEVKKYIEQKKAQQLKQDRLAAKDDSSRRSGRRRNNVISASPKKLLAQVGSQAELNKIMKRGDRQSARMKQAIIYGAVLARKKDLLESESSFMGANGRMYPDLRKAFGKHADVKQCSLCKSRVQGNWFCRITHSHLDKPDHDGGDSVQSLVELFRLSVEDLEGRLSSLIHGGRRQSHKKKSASWGFDGTDWSMNVLSEDLLYQIASFLPNLSQLVSFCKTSKRSQQLLYRSVHSEKLFRGVFLRAFGEQGTKGNFERNLSWRERWSMIRDLRRGLVKKCIRPPSAVSRQLRESVGVLSSQDEREALFYDNPGYGDPERAHCNGYFAMEILHLPWPPNAGPDWQPPIIVRGDFNGIKIFESMAELYYHESNGQRLSQNPPVTLGGNEGGGQVLSLIHCDVEATSLQANEGCPPCCFIGDASGRVAAISATLTPEGDKYTFRISGRQHAHESEVTDMSFVNCSSLGKDVPVLFSACCAGKVYFYPNALNPDHFSLDQSVLAFSNFYDCPIFSMASTVIHFQGQPYSILCTGDRDGNIRLWLKPDGDLVDLCTSTTEQKFRHIQMYKSSTQRGTGYHLVTRAMFLENNLLITGTNNGDVRFWQLQCLEDPSRDIDKGPVPNLTLRYDLMGIHSGAVELLISIGDVLLSSGGNDGVIVGWDISTGLRLGSIRCHPGRQMGEGGDTAKSCVVDVLMSGKDGSLISLCRDGSLRQFNL